MRAITRLRLKALYQLWQLLGMLGQRLRNQGVRLTGGRLVAAE